MRSHLTKHIHRLAIITLSLVLVFSSLAVTTTDVSAATSPVSINMAYYGLHSAAIDETIITANPTFLIGSSPIGPMAGNADIDKFTAAGIKYFEYLTGGYETKYPKGLPVDLQSNLDFIDAAAAAGAYGIFFDEVSDGIWTTPDYSYLQQISSRARSLGLKIVFNTGVNNWVDQLMDYCDYIGSTEQWTNAPLTASQQKWSNQVWLLRREGIDDAVTAASLTIGAWDKGVLSAYATSSLMTLPSWLPEYISLILPYSPDPAEPAPPSSTMNLSVVLQGGSRPDAGWIIPLTVQFFPPRVNVLTDTPAYQFALTTTKSDATAVTQVMGVIADNYDITAVSEHTLVNVKRNVAIANSGTNLNMGTLLEGNANDDNIINIQDFGILAGSYGKSSGNAGYDARADFDRSGLVNIIDFGLLAANYGKTAPVIVP